MSTPRLGPVLGATVCTPDLDASLAAWCGALAHQAIEQGTIGECYAATWGQPDLAGCRFAWLANTLGEAWLELIELPGTRAADPFGRHGWLALEIAVADVDRLASELATGPWRMIGQPASLDFSDAIRAMQVSGPAGEILYLTQISGPVPPFELPAARCAVDRLFIAVLLAGDREAALATYTALSPTDAQRFETRIGVINRAGGLDLATRHPVAALQLAGCSLIEIDQLEPLSGPDRQSGLPAGIASVRFASTALPAGAPVFEIPSGPLQGRSACRLRGAAGERIELIELRPPARTGATTNPGQ